MKFKSAWGAILGAIGFGSVSSEEEPPQVTEERLEQLNSSLEAANSTIAERDASIAQLQADLTQAKADNAEATATVATLTEERDNALAEVKRLGEQPGEGHTASKKETNSEGGTPDEQAQIIDNLPHNKAADEIIL